MGSGHLSVSLRRAFADLGRGLQQLAPDAPAEHASALQPALSILREALDDEGSITLAVGPSGLTWAGISVHSERPREPGICSRLHQDGVRSLTFRAGLTNDELLGLCALALHDPRSSAQPGREDAVTALWKAGFEHIGYLAIDLDRLERTGHEGSRAAEPPTELRERARQALLAAPPPLDAALREHAPPLISRERLAGLDAQAWPQLAQRTAIALLRIVEQGQAGRELAPLEELFRKLLVELSARGELALAGRILELVRKLGGRHAARFRAFVGEQLAQPALMSQLLEQSAANESTERKTLPIWLSLLPREQGPALLDRLAQVPAALQPALARAALDRVGPGSERLAAILAKETAAQALALLSAFDSLPPLTRAHLGALALRHSSSRVRIEAASAVASAPEFGAPLLGELLGAPESSVRTAAAFCLSRCTIVPEQAGRLLLKAMRAPEFQRRESAEQLAFHRALGRLGSLVGFNFLVKRLNEGGSLFRKGRSETLRLMAITGLAEESSTRAMRALDIASARQARQPPSVMDAAHAAALRLRQHRGRDWRA